MYYESDSFKKLSFNTIKYHQLSQRYTQSTDLNYHMLTLHILSLSTADPIFRKYRNKLKLLYLKLLLKHHVVVYY